MKCIKSIKPIKDVEIGTIKRIDDTEDNARVDSGNWKFVPKSEYKAISRTSVDLPKPITKSISDKKLK